MPLLAIDAKAQIIDSQIFTAYDSVKIFRPSRDSWIETYEPDTVAVTLSESQPELHNCNIYGPVAIGNYDDTQPPPNNAAIKGCQIDFDGELAAAIFMKGNGFAAGPAFISISDSDITGLGLGSPAPVILLDQNCQQINIWECRIGGTGADGIEINDARSIDIADCVFNGIQGWSVNAQTVLRLTVRDSNFDLYADADGGVLIADDAHDVIVAGNQLIGTGSLGMPIQVLPVTDPSDTIAILDNQIRVAQLSGIDVAGWTAAITNLVVQGNTIIGTNPSQGTDLTLAFSHDAVVSDNTLTNGQIYVFDCDRLQLLSDIVLLASTNRDWGFEIYDSDEIWIQGCAVVVSADAFAVYLETDVTNTLVRDASNNWRGATSGVEDNGTGTIT